MARFKGSFEAIRIPLYKILNPSTRVGFAGMTFDIAIN